MAALRLLLPCSAGSWLCCSSVHCEKSFSPPLAVAPSSAAAPQRIIRLGLSSPCFSPSALWQPGCKLSSLPWQICDQATTTVTTRVGDGTPDVPVSRCPPQPAPGRAGRPSPLFSLRFGHFHMHTRCDSGFLGFSVYITSPCLLTHRSFSPGSRPAPGRLPRPAPPPLLAQSPGTELY